MSLETKLEQLGYGRSETAIMIPLATLRNWTDEELLQLKDAEVNLITTKKIRKYLVDRYSCLGVKRKELKKLFPYEFED